LTRRCTCVIIASPGEMQHSALGQEKRRRAINKAFRETITLVLSIVLLFSFCPICFPAEPQAQDFITIKNKSPQDIFDDANYLYQLGDFEGALALFNRAYDQADNPALKRKAKLGAEVTALLLKSERVSPKDAQKVIRRAGKIKERQKKEQLDELYKDAFGCYFKEDYEKSAEIFRKILELYPEEAMAKDYLRVKIPQEEKKIKAASLYQQALSDLADNNYDQAITGFQKALALDPAHKEAKDYLEQKIPAKLAQDKRQKIDVLYRQALSDFADKKYDSAAESFKEILVLEPGEAQAADYIKVKIPDLLKAEKIASLYPQALEYFKQADYEKSLQVFNEILSLDPGQKEAKDYAQVKIPAILTEQKVKALYLQANAYYQIKSYAKAEEFYRQILALDPKQEKARGYVEKEIPQRLKEIEDAKRLMVRKDAEKFALEMEKAKAKELRERQEQDRQARRVEQEKELAARKKSAQVQVAAKEKKVMKKQEKPKSAEQPVLAPPAPKKEPVPEKKQEVALKREQASPSRLGVPMNYPRDGVVGYMYETAFKYYKEGDLELAGEYFRKILLTDPGQQLAKRYLQETFK